MEYRHINAHDEGLRKIEVIREMSNIYSFHRQIMRILRIAFHAFIIKKKQLGIAVYLLTVTTHTFHHTTYYH